MMKLRFSPTSPFVRKVTAMLIECGLEDQVTRIDTNSWEPDSDIAAVNPLGKVPALVTSGGEVLYDSPVICEYLDSLHDGIKLFPPAGGARWTALRRQALGDGINDAVVVRFLEDKREDGERSQAWADRYWYAAQRSLDALEDEADSLGEAVTIGHLAIGCALGYLDFRFADEDWRPGRPALADWWAGFSARRSMMETEPQPW